MSVCLFLQLHYTVVSAYSPASRETTKWDVKWISVLRATSLGQIFPITPSLHIKLRCFSFLALLCTPLLIIVNGVVQDVTEKLCCASLVRSSCN